MLVGMYHYPAAVGATGCNNTNTAAGDHPSPYDGRVISYPDFHATSDDVIVDIDRATVAIRWRATGTHRGPFLGLASTGQVIEFQGIEVIRIDPSRGQIVEHWGEWDGLGLVEQLRRRR